VEVATEPDNNKKAALARFDTLNVGAPGGKPDDDVVEKLDLAIQQLKPKMNTAKDRFLYYAEKLEGFTKKEELELKDGHLINEAVFQNAAICAHFKMNTTGAQVLKQICVKGLKTGEKFDRVSVARIFCDDLVFWDEDHNTLAF
jgi:hypothetical protein